jgi:hypothetical protein
MAFDALSVSCFGDALLERWFDFRQFNLLLFLVEELLDRALYQFLHL